MSTAPHIVSPEEIMAHLDGELSADRAQAVSTHIEACADCRSLLEDFQQTEQNVASWRVAALPAASENRIQSAAAKRPASSATSSPAMFRRARRRTWRPWALGLGLTAALLLVLAIATPNLHRSRMVSKEVDAARLQTNKTLPLATPESVDNFQGIASPAQDSLSTRGQKASQSGDALQLEPIEKGKNMIRSSERERRPAQAPEQGAYMGRLPSGPLIARALSLSIIAKDFDSARGSLDSILARHNGYAASLSANSPEGSARSIQASLRIPAAQLAAALAELKLLGRVELENQSGEEVTQQHADLVARLKNSRETEERLQAILTQRTGKISDVLEVEQEIARVRGEIEQMEAEQKNLEHRVDFATIDLKLSEEYKAQLDSPAASISTQIHNAVVHGYRNVADTLLAIILFFAEYGPVLCFWLLVLAVPAWLVRRHSRHAATA